MIDFKGLNESQKNAVFSNSSALLVLAGAGTGKTRVITYRIARLIKDGCAARHILAVTFTNKAAREMRERLAQMLGEELANDLVVSTFHSFCARLLRKEGYRIGLGKRFSILDAAEQLAQITRVMKAHGFDPQTIKPRQILSQISWWKNQGIRARHAAQIELKAGDQHQRWVERAARDLYPHYQAHLKSLKTIDFDDMLLYAVQLLNDEQTMLAQVRGGLKHILIDEYQDTNPIQSALVDLLNGPTQHLCVVGDDDQAIYGFRGSAIENILDFDQRHHNAEVIRLEDNYRCSGHILDLANHVIAQNVHRRGKRLRAASEKGQPVSLVRAQRGDDEGELVAQMIQHALFHRQTVPGEIAVLYRSNPQSRLFEEALRARDIPYRVIGGQEFFQRQHVKNVLAMMRLLIVPDDELAFRRIVNLPARGRGPKLVEEWWTLTRHLKMSPFHLVSDAEVVDWIPARRLDDMLEWTRRYIDAAAAVEIRPESSAEVLADLVYGTAYQMILENESNLATRHEIEDHIEEVLNGFSRWCERYAYGKAHPKSRMAKMTDTDLHPIQSYLDRVTVEEEEAQKEHEEREKRKKEREENKVTLMSIHASKGLEFKHVYVVGCEEGLLPHRRSIDDGERAIEEERRLAYVAMTRAMTQLTISHSKMRRRRGEWVPRTPSRFLDNVMELDCTQDALAESAEPEAELAQDFFSRFLKPDNNTTHEIGDE